MQGGGFKRVTFDLPALLYDTDLLRLYDALIAEDLRDLVLRYADDRDKFLAYLKDMVGMAKLADRQLVANALARAQRLGTFNAALAQAAASV